MKNRKGFTLVELMVVIALMAILTAVVLPNIQSIRGRSRDTKRVADISQLRLAVEHYFNTFRKYPTDIYTDTNFISAGIVSNPVPTDPNGGNYRYAPYCNGGGTTPNGFHLGAVLEQNNNNLTGDADIVPSASIPYQVCSGVTDFDGTDNATTFVYDLVNN